MGSKECYGLSNPCISLATSSLGPALVFIHDAREALGTMCFPSLSRL